MFHQLSALPHQQAGEEISGSDTMCRDENLSRHLACAGLRAVQQGNSNHGSWAAFRTQAVPYPCLNPSSCRTEGLPHTRQSGQPLTSSIPGAPMAARAAGRFHLTLDSPGAVGPEQPVKGATCLRLSSLYPVHPFTVHYWYN